MALEHTESECLCIIIAFIPPGAKDGKEDLRLITEVKDDAERIKWWKIGLSLCAEVTFQRKPGRLNTPLSRPRPSADDGVRLYNDKEELTFICLHLFPLPPPLCYYCGSPLFPFISLYA